MSVVQISHSASAWVRGRQLIRRKLGHYLDVSDEQLVSLRRHHIYQRVRDRYWLISRAHSPMTNLHSARHESRPRGSVHFLILISLVSGPQEFIYTRRNSHILEDESWTMPSSEQLLQCSRWLTPPRIIGRRMNGLWDGTSEEGLRRAEEASSWRWRILPAGKDLRRNAGKCQVTSVAWKYVHGLHYILLFIPTFPTHCVRGAILLVVQ